MTEIEIKTTESHHQENRNENHHANNHQNGDMHLRETVIHRGLQNNKTTEGRNMTKMTMDHRVLDINEKHQYDAKYHNQNPSKHYNDVLERPGTTTMNQPWRKEEVTIFMLKLQCRELLTRTFQTLMKILGN